MEKKMTAASDRYRARMLRVLAFIDANPDANLDLETLSKVAAFSKFHFHRQFSATFGLSVHRYVELSRLKKASQALAGSDAQSVTMIAMDAGFEAPDAFARAFRRRLAQTPLSFRKGPDWTSWLSAFGPLDNARNSIMQITFQHDDVAIVEQPDIQVAVMQHRGDRENLVDTLGQFRAWCNARGLTPDTGRATFMIFRSEREPEKPEDYSVDIGVETIQQIPQIDGNIRASAIPGGRCARLRYPGNSNNLEPAVHFLYNDWLPWSGEEARDFPVYSRRRLVSIAGTDAREVALEIFLPLK